MADRGVSTALGYVLGLAIITVMITGLFMTTSDVVTDQREQVIRSELRVLGNQIAADITTVDRLAIAGNDSRARLTRSLPGTVAGSPYEIRLRHDGSQPATIELTSRNPEVSVTVRVANGTAIENSTRRGGKFVVYYRGNVVSLDSNTPGGWPGLGGTVITTDGSGDLRVIKGDGGGVFTIPAVSDVAGVGGPAADVTSDSRDDLPLVTGSDTVAITNGTNATTTLATSADIPGTIESAKTRLATGSWNDSPRSVFFVNENHDTLFRVAPGGSPVPVATPGNNVQAVAGVADIDADGTEELVFADGSQQLRYLEPNGTTFNIDGGQTGSNNGIGAGSFADFDDDGALSVAAVDGSNVVKYVEHADEGKVEIAGTDAKKAPVTTADVDDDGEPEIVYIGNSNGKLKYVDDVDGSPSIRFLNDEDGNQIDGSDSSGVGS